MIDRATIERIMDAANIVEVVSEFVSLKKTGANYKGLCPFHNEKTPSFVVSPAKGLCHCFSCGKGGTVVSFLMEHEQMTYVEALRWLAKKYSIEIQEKELSEEEKRARSERESMFLVNDWAMKYFQENLKTSEEGQSLAMNYLRSRGFRDDIISKFSIGYCLKQKDALAREALSKGFKEKYLLDTGLCYKKDDGQLQDRYWARIIFPIYSSTGRVVAFGGRILSNDKKIAKYVNSPESIIYHKSSELFGLYQARGAITKEDCCFLVEGYTDVTSMHQAGIENVVASSGTSLTEGQIKLISRYTSNITVLYDGDSAGIKASIRGIDMLLAAGLNVRVLLLPEGEDPDSFARGHSTEEFQNYIKKNQTDFINFKAHLLLEGETDPVRRSEAINSILRSVSTIEDPIVRATYIKESSRLCLIAEKTIVNTINKFRRALIDEKRKQQSREELSQKRQEESPFPPSPQTITPKKEDSPQSSRVEYMLMQIVVRYGERIIFSNVEAEDGSLTDVNLAQYVALSLGYDDLKFKDEKFNEILREAVEHSSKDGFSSENYFMHHPKEEISALAAGMVIDKYHLSKSLQMNISDDALRSQVEHLLVDFHCEYIEDKIRELKAQMKIEKDPSKKELLKAEYKETLEIRSSIASQRGQIL
ncbi:MAG: DNA primase [Prevotella sp.]|nr:DNA primase [Prevotella sp.]